MSESPHPKAAWVSLGKAAQFLDESPQGLRKKLDRAARLENGSIVARIPGLRARKLGKLWKVYLDGGWLQ